MANPDNVRARSPIDRAFLTDQEGTGTLILVRHGQQRWPDPTTSVPADWADPPLSEKGVAQAQCVGRWLADRPISAVYSSHLLRANDTGKAIAAHHGLDVEVVEDLAEIHLYGGLASDEKPVDLLGHKAVAGVWERFVQTQKWDSYPFTESSSDFRRRVGWAIESTIVEHPGETVVVACHGGVINAYLAELLGVHVDMFFRPFHASSHRLLYGQGRRVIETLNEDSYLAAEDLLTH
ncbi:MAG: histidine phosphatase family protein [Actinomycetia bacterium]|nr:histidine phosphatase family protein [Actinomycetes bacterium]MCP4957736.1 histidine phosphatase family protein [Actinomycetes bacterium]